MCRKMSWLAPRHISTLPRALNAFQGTGVRAQQAAPDEQVSDDRADFAEFILAHLVILLCGLALIYMIWRAA